MSEVLMKISEAIIEGNVDDIVDLTEEALDEGSTAEEVLNLGLMAGMDYVGVEFKAGNMFVPEVLRSAKAMQSAMELLRPLLAKAGIKHTGKLLLGTVKGDLHDIGKNLVGMMCEGAGFEVTDLGKDIDARTVRGCDQRAAARCVGHVRAFDHDHARDGTYHQGPGRSGSARSG